MRVNGFGDSALMTSLVIFFNLQEIQVLFVTWKISMEEQVSHGDWLFSLSFLSTTFYFEKCKTHRKVGSLDLSIVYILPHLLSFSHLSTHVIFC